MKPAPQHRNLPFRKPGKKRSPAGIWVRGALPAISVLVLLVITLLPWGISGFGRVTPVLPLIAIFFWTLDLPGHMPSLFVFGAGLLFDFLSGTPGGLWAFGFLVLYGITITQRQALAGRPFMVSWAGFMLASSAACVGVWLVASVVRGVVLPPLPGLVSLVLTIALYPLLVRLLGRIRRMTGLEYEA